MSQSPRKRLLWRDLTVFDGLQVLTEPELGNLPTPTRIRAAEWLAARLDRARGDEFVGRVVLRGRAVRVSATVDERIEDRIIGDADA